jgi:type I restriction enzyme, S subunit
MMLPEGWTNTKFASGFTSSREKGSLGLPTLSVTIYGGLVDRDSIDRKMDTNLDPNEHLLVRKGDIAYNMMRMWQGASGLAEHNAIVSPAYVVLRAKKGMDPLFASYLFKLRHMIHQFWAYSYGLTEDRLRLYPKDFGMIPVILPPIAEQRRIAEILSNWDQAIAVQERLVANARAQKKALMQTLLTGKKRLPGFKGEWKKVRLDEAAYIIVSNVDKKSDADEAPVRLCNYMDVYRADRIEADMQFMRATAAMGQIKKFALKVGDVLITKDSETPDDIAIPSYVASTAPDLICGYHLAIIRSKKETDGQFLKFYFEHPHTRYFFGSRANGATRFGLTVGAIESAPITLPHLAEQKCIGEAIANAELEILRLVPLVQTLKREKSALMQQLLTGKRRVKVEAKA